MNQFSRPKTAPGNRDVPISSHLRRTPAAEIALVEYYAPLPVQAFGPTVLVRTDKAQGDTSYLPSLHMESREHTILEHGVNNLTVEGEGELNSTSGGENNSNSLVIVDPDANIEHTVSNISTGDHIVSDASDKSKPPQPSTLESEIMEVTSVPTEVQNCAELDMNNTKILGTERELMRTTQLEDLLEQGDTSHGGNRQASLVSRPEGEVKTEYPQSNSLEHHPTSNLGETMRLTTSENTYGNKDTNETQNSASRSEGAAFSWFRDNFEYLEERVKRIEGLAEEARSEARIATDTANTAVAATTEHPTFKEAPKEYPMSAWESPRVPGSVGQRLESVTHSRSEMMTPSNLSGLARPLSGAGTAIKVAPNSPHRTVIDISLQGGVQVTVDGEEPGVSASAPPPKIKSLEDCDVPDPIKRVESPRSESKSRREGQLPRRKPVGRRFDRAGSRTASSQISGGAMLSLMRKEAWS